MVRLFVVVLTLAATLFGWNSRASEKLVAVGIDVSGSMVNFIPEVKSVYKKIDREIPSGADVYAFSSGVRKLSVQNVDSLRAGGSTNMSAFLNLVKDRGYKVVILITDGAPDNPSLVAKLAQEIRKGGTKLCSAYVGSGDRAAKDFLSSISDVLIEEFSIKDSIRRCISNPAIRRFIVDKTQVRDANAARRLFW